MNKRKNNNSPLKIAVLGHKTIPSRQGGIEIVVEELTVRMAKLGCLNICPKHAIYMKHDEKGYLYPEIRKDSCVNCGLCEKVCPLKDLKH